MCWDDDRCLRRSNASSRLRRHPARGFHVVAVALHRDLATCLSASEDAARAGEERMKKPATFRASRSPTGTEGWTWIGNRRWITESFCATPDLSNAVTVLLLQTRTRQSLVFSAPLTCLHLRQGNGTGRLPSRDERTMLLFRYGYCFLRRARRVQSREVSLNIRTIVMLNMLHILSFIMKFMENTQKGGTNLKRPRITTNEGRSRSTSQRHERHQQRHGPEGLSTGSRGHQKL